MSAGGGFSFPSYRRLCRYLGETDALVELTELSARAFLSNARESRDIGAFVSETSAMHGINVNLAEVENLSIHLSQSYLVTVYSSAERFLHEFREEHSGFYQRAWKGDARGVDPLTVTLINIATGQGDAEKRLGQDLITRYHYYRAVRNKIVHTKDSDPSKTEELFHEIVPYSTDHDNIFGSIRAPNCPSKLNFDDFIFFSRLTKAIAAQICQIAAPSDEDWNRFVSGGELKRFKRLSTNRVRMQNAVAGRIKTEFGMDNKTAQWIAGQLCDSLA